MACRPSQASRDGDAMSTKTQGPKCEDCGRRMWWGELLRTWICRNCGYFLDDVDPITGEVEMP